MLYEIRQLNTFHISGELLLCGAVEHVYVTNCKLFDAVHDHIGETGRLWCYIALTAVDTSQKKKISSAIIHSNYLGECVRMYADTMLCILERAMSRSICHAQSFSSE